jgi:hypothetical protein
VRTYATKFAAAAHRGNWVEEGRDKGLKRCVRDRLWNSSPTLMLMNLSAPIEWGKPFKATLMFAKAGPVEVEFAIGPIGSRTAPRAGTH